MEVKIPISLGELFDKVSILEIKSEKISEKTKLSHIKKELESLKKIVSKLKLDENKIKPLYEKLKLTNSELWVIEDEIRILEKNNDFGENFVELARSVYITNDKRFEIKNLINNKFNSSYFEEKSYEKY